MSRPRRACGYVGYGRGRVHLKVFSVRNPAPRPEKRPHSPLFCIHRDIFASYTTAANKASNSRRLIEFPATYFRTFASVVTRHQDFISGRPIPQLDFEAFLNLHLAFPRYTVFGQLALQKVQRSGPLAKIRFHVALPSNSFSFEVSVFENETNKLQQPHKTAETRGTVS